MTKEDYKDINNPDNWDNELTPGSGCSKCQSFINEHIVQTRTGKILCLNCVTENLHSEVYYKFQGQNVNTIIKNLQGKWGKTAVQAYQGLSWINSRLESEAGIDKDFINYLDLIMNHLGYSGHILARLIRSLAFNILYNIQDYSIPHILSKIENIDILEGQWQFGINLGLLVAEINPIPQKIQDFLQLIWNHPCEEARKFIQSKLINKNGVIYSPDVGSKIKEMIQLYNFELIDKSSDRVFTMDYQTHSDMFDFIMAEYQLDALKHFYTTYWEKSFTLKNDFTESSAKKKIPIKRELAATFTIIISNKDLFLDFYHKTSEVVQKIFSFLVFTHSYQSVKDLLEVKKIEIIKKQSNNDRNKKPEVIDMDYYLWQFKYEYNYNENDCYYIYCDSVIFHYVKNYLEKPETLKLQYRESVKSTMNFNESKKIEQHLLNLPEFIQSNPPGFNINGSISAAYIKKLINYFEIKEFYPGTTSNELKYIRSTMFILYIQQYYLPAFNAKKHITDSTVFEHLKTSVKYFTNKPLFSWFIFDNFLSYLHFDSFNYQNYLTRHGSKFEKKLSQGLKTVISLLKTDSWLLFDSLITHYFVENLIFPVVKADRGDLYFYRESSYSFSNSREKAYVNAEKDIKVTFTPFLKCWFFLLANFGLIELAYSEPHNSDIQKHKKEYLSTFDGLEAIRLTKLGAYVFEKNVEQPEEQGQSDFEVNVDNAYLIIYTKGENSGKEYMLESMAQKKRPGMYSVSYHTFVKNCATLDQVQIKIKQFRKFFCKSPSSVWTDFFNTIVNRFNQISRVNSYKLFKIKDNAQLKKLFYSDPVLKQHCLRAEDHHVLIKQDKLNIVKKRLEKEGFVAELN